MKALLKKILSPSTRLALREAWGRVIGPVLPGYLKVVSSSGLLSGLHYTLLSSAFSREYRGVLRGRLHYLGQMNQGAANMWLLRRNTHRLEKGLIMRPRRGVFALDYIEETMLSFEAAFSMGVPDTGSLQWSKNVLAEYFAVTTEHPKIDRVRNRFRQLTEQEDPSGESIPYTRDLTNLSVDYDSFLKLCHRRRSVRWYLDQPVPRDLLDQAIMAARQSPSACNRQPFEFRIFDEPALVKKVAAIPGGTAGFSYQFPCMVIVVGLLNAYYHEKDRHLIYIDGSLASMSFMFALETLGLSSCPINWPDVADREAEMTRALGLEADERVVMCISVGYPSPDGLVPYSEKKSLDAIRSYNRIS